MCFLSCQKQQDAWIFLYQLFFSNSLGSYPVGLDCIPLITEGEARGKERKARIQGGDRERQRSPVTC